MIWRIITLSLIPLFLLSVCASCTTGDNDSYIHEILNGLTGQVFYDARGDIFGVENSQHDILSIEVFYDTDTHTVLFNILFSDAVLPVTGPDDLTQLYGYLEIDVDQVPDSGSVSTIDDFITFAGLQEPLTNMYVDYTVSFHSYDTAFNTVDILTPDPGGDLAGYAPVIFEKNNCLVIIPIDVLSNMDGSFAFALLIGTEPEATDLTAAYTYSTQ